MSGLDFDPECAPPGEVIFQAAPGQLSHLAATNSANIAQHIAKYDEKEYDPITGQMVTKSSRENDEYGSVFKQYQKTREGEGDESNTGQGYNLNVQDEDGFAKPKLLPPGLSREEGLALVTPDNEDGNDMEAGGFIAFQKKKQFDNEFQERADRVRRLHAPRFGKYKDPDRPIYASEIKSWFHAWLGKQHLAAHYDYESSMSLTEDGEQQYMYTVECTVTGFKHTARCKMEDKKECQTGATWLFMDWMILNNHIDPRIIPFEKDDIYVDIKHVNLDDGEENKRSIYTKKMRFVSAGKLNTDGSEEMSVGDMKSRKTWEHSAPSDVEKAAKVVEMIFGGKSKPIGMEYVEFLHGSGKNRFHCRLCDVEVTDEAGRAMHVRGRKHKLNYKRFVDPDLGIGKLSAEEERTLKADVLEYQKTLAQEHKNRTTEIEQRDMELMHHEMLEEFCYQVYEDYEPTEREELNKILAKEGRTLKYKCPSLKHIYAHSIKFEQPDYDNLCRKKLALQNEFRPIDGKAMREVQDFENALLEVFQVIDSENPNNSWLTWPHPIKRTGSYVKGYPVDGERDSYIQFVIVCTRHPTRELIQGVVEKLREKLDPRVSPVGIVKVQPNTFSVNYNRKYHLPVHFTSYKLFNKTAVIPRYYGTPLERDQCIKHLMDVERKTHFKRYFAQIPGYIETLKLMADICERSESWNQFKGWPLEVIVRNALGSAVNASIWPSTHGSGCYEGVSMQPQHLTIARCLKRVFEYVGSGSLQLYGLLDPCELIVIERQILKKLVGYDEDDVITMDDGQEEELPTTDAGMTNYDLKIMADKNALNNEQIVLKKKEMDNAEDLNPNLPNMGVGLKKEDEAWSGEDEKPVVEEKPKKRKRASKFGKKAEDVQEVKTVTVMKKSDKEELDQIGEKLIELEELAEKRPKMMSFVKAGEQKEDSDNSDEEPDVVDNKEDLRVKTSGKHIDLVSSFRPQAIEDITSSAHILLRMVNFGMLHKALGVRADIVTAQALEEERLKELIKKRKAEKVDLPNVKGVNFAMDTNVGDEDVVHVID